jgi:hypothetical protein
VNNVYNWTIGHGLNGTAFTDFLAKLNDPFGVVAAGEIYGSPPATGCFAGHCDRLLVRVPVGRQF